MKRTIAIMLAALMLTGILTACSGTLGMDDGRAYGNVSTTPNGTVNGTNRDSYNGNHTNGGYQNGTGSNHGGSGYQSGSSNGANSSGSGYQSGTGMTGGR